MSRRRDDAEVASRVCMYGKQSVQFSVISANGRAVPWSFVYWPWWIICGEQCDAVRHWDNGVALASRPFFGVLAVLFVHGRNAENTDLRVCLVNGP